MIRALLVAALLAGCGGSGATTTAEPTTTADPTATATATAQAATDTPAPTATNAVGTIEPLHPTVALTRWQALFGDELAPLITEGGMADAFESDFYWVDSVDRLAYSTADHRFTMDATIDFESVYMRDPQEWRDDTWTLYRAWARDVWGGIIGLEDEIAGAIGAPADWPAWTPGLLLSGNGGRITVDCSGELVYAINQRQATQSEFESECAFSH